MKPKTKRGRRGRKKICEDNKENSYENCENDLAEQLNKLNVSEKNENKIPTDIVEEMQALKIDSNINDNSKFSKVNERSSIIQRFKRVNDCPRATKEAFHDQNEVTPFIQIESSWNELSNDEEFNQMGYSMDRKPLVDHIFEPSYLLNCIKEESSYDHQSIKKRDLKLKDKLEENEEYIKSPPTKQHLTNQINSATPLTNFESPYDIKEE